MTTNGDRVTDAAGALRATVDRVGHRIPVMAETARDEALGGARTIQALPDTSQRTLAAFSLGLGVGLSIAGAPRLIVAAMLLPAMVVVATIVGRDGGSLPTDRA